SFSVPHAPRSRLWPTTSVRLPAVARRQEGWTLAPRLMGRLPRRGSSRPTCPVHPLPDSLAAVIQGFSDAGAGADTDATAGTLLGAYRAIDSFTASWCGVFHQGRA